MKKISLAILTLLVALTACKKVPEVNLKYVDVERDLITVGTTTATVQCDYKYIATLKKAYFYYCEGENEADMNTVEMRVVQNTLYIDLVGLKENTTYSYFYEFHNGFNSMRTALKTFKTETGNGGGEEPPTPPEIMLPTVITAMVTEITTNSAQCGGEVTNDGGAEVTERGICWSTNVNPTLSDNHVVAAESGLGEFNALIDSLEANTTYHVCAYATNEAGTAYGLDKEFTTLSGGGSGVPEGAINGLFTINENGDQVYFSQGNLQYQASTNTWRFAENQWNFVGGTEYSGNHFGNVSGSSNNEISPTYEGWIDLFGWGTSGYNHNNAAYQPWATSTHYWQYYAYGSSSYNLYDQTGQADWGYNSIANGGNQAGVSWRTPTNDEWGYLLNTRADAASKRGLGNVNGVNGLILLPDDWAMPDGLSFTPDISGLANTYSVNQWALMEANGAIFFPAAGTREGSSLYRGSGGNYWSSSYSNSFDAYNLLFGSSTTLIPQVDSTRHLGLSVRLVQDANP